MFFKKLYVLQDKIDTFIGKRKWYYTFAIVFTKLFIGFSAKNYFFYELYKKSRYEKKQFMTDRQSKKFEKMNNSHKDASILVDKYEFNNYFNEYVNRDFLYLKDTSLDEFMAFCHKHPSFILKRNWLCEGAGISNCNLENDKEIESFYNEQRGHVLVEEQIIQHDKMEQLHPQSVNTVRVSTLFFNGTPYVVSAALRVGTGNNCTDNLHNAGVACAIDLKTGIVVSEGYDKNANKYLKHPDSGVVLLGFAIPNWDKVLNTVVEAAKKFLMLNG